MTVMVTLSGCTLESFEVEPCSSNGTVGFRIHKIDGWFRDYQPRPHRVLVRTRSGPGSAYPGVWSTDLKYYSDRDNGFDTRRARTHILYGQPIAGWDIDKAPQRLVHGAIYGVVIDDGGHGGWATFVAGTRLPRC